MARLDELITLRDYLRRHLDGAETKEVASVARELRQIAKEIDEIERATPTEGSLSDELAKKRQARVVPKAKNRPSAKSG